MFEPTVVAKHISDTWGGNLPDDLATALQALDESQWVDPPAEVFNVEGCTRENVHIRIAEHAQQIAINESFAKARSAARRALAQRVNALAAEAAPQKLEELRPQFDQASADYIAAVYILGEGRVTGDAIADASPEVQDAYRTATEMAAVIGGIDSWVAGLTNLPGVGSMNHDNVCRVLSPKDRNELSELMGAKSDQPAEKKLDPMLLKAARLGVTFELKTPAEATALRRQIDSMPVVRKPIKFASVYR
jgi:hypothetical protein